MYRKVTAVIAVTVMIVSFAGLATANHTADVDINPKAVQGNARLLFDLEISNSSGSTDNINKIWITSADGTFSEAISGARNGENLENAGENLNTASGFLSDAAGYFSDASVNKADAGSQMLEIYSDVEEAASMLYGTDWDTAADKLNATKYFFERAGENLEADVTDMVYENDQLWTAGDLIIGAADNFHDGSITTEWDDNTYSMLDEAGTRIKNAADNILSGTFSYVAENLKIASSALENAGENMKVSGDSNVKASGKAIVRASKDMMDIALEFEAMENDLLQAGRALGIPTAPGSNWIPIENASRGVYDAGLFLENVANLENAGENLKDAAENIGIASGQFYYHLNVYDTKNPLRNAGKNNNGNVGLYSVGTILEKALGGKYLQDAGQSMQDAGDNLENLRFSLVTASDQLSKSAEYMADAAAELKSAGSDLQTAGSKAWDFTTDTSLSWMPSKAIAP